MGITDCKVTGYGLGGSDSIFDRDKNFLFTTMSRPAVTHQTFCPEGGVVLFSEDEATSSRSWLLTSRVVVK